MKTLKETQNKHSHTFLVPLISVFLVLYFPLNLDAQFKEESARAAFELRMNGEILYAHAMLQKLIDLEKTEGGLVHYEMARTKEHQSNGGAEGINGGQ